MSKNFELSAAIFSRVVNSAFNLSILKENFEKIYIFYEKNIFLNFLLDFEEKIFRFIAKRFNQGSQNCILRAHRNILRKKTLWKKVFFIIFWWLLAHRFYMNITLYKTSRMQRNKTLMIVESYQRVISIFYNDASTHFDCWKSQYGVFL